MDKLSYFLVLTITITAGVCLLVWLTSKVIGKAKYRSVRAAGFFWTMQFLGLQDTPPPTPQEQTEQENREKKNRGAGDDSKG